MGNTTTENWCNHYYNVWHNTLQNFFLRKLKVLIRNFQNGEIDLNRLLDFLKDDLPVWDTKLKKEIEQLIRNFEPSLSPLRYMDESSIISEKYFWLRPFIQELWKARCAVVAWPEKIRKVCIEIDLAWESILQKVKDLNQSDQKFQEEILVLKRDFQHLNMLYDDLYNSLCSFRIEEFI